MVPHLRFIVMRDVNITNGSMNALRNAVVIFGLALSAGLAVGVRAAAADPKEAGVWYDDTGKGAVKIDICTPTTLCGKIYWLK